MPETNLKWVLMELGNRLVLKHGFDPPIVSIKIFTEFLNKCPEAQIILREMGFEWPVSERPDQSLEARRRSVAEILFSDYNFGEEVVEDCEGWESSGDTLKCVFFFEDVSESRRGEFHVTFKPNSTQVLEMDWE